MHKNLAFKSARPVAAPSHRTSAVIAYANQMVEKDMAVALGLLRGDVLVSVKKSTKSRKP